MAQELTGKALEQYERGEALLNTAEVLLRHLRQDWQDPVKVYHCENVLWALHGTLESLRDVIREALP